MDNVNQDPVPHPPMDSLPKNPEFRNDPEAFTYAHM